MKFRTLGQSDLEFPVVTFGAWAIGGWMWGGTDDAQAVKAIQAGIDAGITAIDTAPVYGRGYSEELVGRAIAGRRDQVIVATKCGVRWDVEQGEYSFTLEDEHGEPKNLYRTLDPASIREECERSLKRLNIDAIDLYQCHWPDSTTPLADTMEALLDLQQQGKIRHIGVSNFFPEMMEECLKHGPIVSDQPKYNPLERDVESELVPFCQRHSIGILAYSPIAQGLMTGKVTMDRTFPKGDLRASRPWFKPQNRQRVLDALEEIRPIADAHNATLAQVTIAWVVAQPGITTALVGARTPEQAIENAAAGTIELSANEIAEFRRVVEALGAPEP